MTDLMVDDFTYDFIVVGAGVEGSATALNIVEKALNSSVAMLEQVCTSVATSVYIHKMLNSMPGY